ncbi:MAG: Lrp/AsnC ligand binding domain-containing protein [Paludibacter sp.]|jgi:Lrp/AsnC family transcriptional regulator for asnA, asnC and gidA|nr:Lrp/AsnC ligand binding domain-containing protein [Paludibacter sp.]
MPQPHRIDQLDKKILQLIAQDARIPFLEVARECNVSGAAIHQRIQKLKNTGIIKGSEFIIDNYKVGYQTCAFIGITLNDSKAFARVADELKKIPEIVECHFSTGKYSLFVKIYARDNRHLFQVIIERITGIPGISHTETFQISLDEVFNRQLSVFDASPVDEEEPAE